MLDGEILGLVCMLGYSRRRLKGVSKWDLN